MATLSPELAGPARQIVHGVAALVRRALGILVFCGLAAALGIGSAWYMIETGTTLSTRRDGSWVTWPSAARLDADPYTRARFVTHGRLAIHGGAARTYEASTDSDGRKLHSSCEYAVTGSGPEGAWWSLSVFDERGGLIPNPAERYAYNRHTVALRPTGTFLITLSRDARPGNWLPTGGAGRLALVLTILNTPGETSGSGAEGAALPEIKRVQCR